MHRFCVLAQSKTIMQDVLLYQIGITLLPMVGDVNGKRLVAYCGGVEAVFKESKSALLKIPGIGMATVNAIRNQQVLGRAEEELQFIHKQSIRSCFFTESDYPMRLLHCDDGPMMIYYKGKMQLNHPRVLAVVGTRRATQYGKHICAQIIEGLSDKDVLIMSGLAYGIDSCAHRSAHEANMQTIGVLGHGLDRIYPAQNRKLAALMQENGGLLTEFLSGTIPDRENFPKRNRIVAGMCDALLVVESDRKGGALITAEIANSYNRDVFAVPGKVGDPFSRGCNFLIRNNKAALAESSGDISYIMGWEDRLVERQQQPSLFIDLTEEEQNIMDCIQEVENIGIDQLALKVRMPVSKVAAILLHLEFEGLVRSLPGKLYAKA